MTASQPITPGQKKQFRRFVQDAANRAVSMVLKHADIDKEGFQRVFPRGDELQFMIEETLKKAIRELAVGRYLSEEVPSAYGYLSGYKPKGRGMTEQTNRLRQLFSGVGFADEKLADRALPKNAEGWFAIPRWQSLAPTYGEALELVLRKLSDTRSGRFYNYRGGSLGEKFLRQSEKSLAAWRKLGEEQTGYDILVVPAQFGLLHRGRSVRRAREVMLSDQFGLGAFAIGIMLLTHPERLEHFDDLWIDCAGDEFSLNGGGVFSGAPYFGFSGGELKFGAGDCSYDDGDCGSASAFLAQ